MRVVLFSAVAIAIAAWIGTAMILRLLERRAILDRPNPRSSHSQPTPRGGGIAVIAAIAVAWLVWSGLDRIPGDWWPILAATLTLALVSWADDLRGMSVWLRLLAHVAAVAVGASLLDDNQLVFQGLLPPWLDHVGAALLWLWFINLYNFMDGIDGITAVETIAIGVGLFVTTLIVGWDHPVSALALMIAAAATGFLPWNWSPARIFLGDVGSVPLGFVLGWLLLVSAAAGWWMVALILPLYYLADATITLARRVVRGERIWRAHAGHFYQQAARRLESHARATLAIAATNALLIAAAIAGTSILAPWLAVIFSVGIVAILLWYFARKDATAE